MSLIIFMIAFALVNVGILKYAQRELGNQYIPGYISTYDVEKNRKKLNSRFSRF